MGEEQTLEKEKNFINYEEIELVAIPHIDEQHRLFLKLTAEFYEFQNKNSENLNESFKVFIKKFVELIKIHFLDEEHILERISYPEYVEHRLEHENFIKKILEAVKKFDTGKDFVFNEFVHFLRDWVLNHISLWDIKYAEYISFLKKSAG